MTRNLVAERKYAASSRGRVTRRAYERSQRQSRQRFIDSVKLTCGCVDCGYRANADGLEFDHVLPRLHGKVSGNLRRWTAILEEMDRCEVRCGTCHNIVTAARRPAAMKRVPVTYALTPKGISLP